ncbi:3-methyl-2-oxobutanoate hydroxymethyltransferase [Nocardia sp. NRRL S-836]|uniref:3-methyl-2-oxobutanoate hydroxymethyltransferase n=1 Tax=Nocardia sp. NRRL S-836 TaxID=1519492 RepID=UPI000ACDCF51|nr:3-methyl-2-oxobutanoate hydroxymethyltransferase [Nocardia sp. NRRL S-836]
MSEGLGSLYGVEGRRLTGRDLATAKKRGEPWAMLTAYDALTARIFDDVGVPVLLVGDSAANVVFGYDSTLPVTVDELLPLLRAVTGATSRCLVVGDMPFGSYQGSPQKALDNAARFMKEGRAQAVKLEGGRAVLPQVETLVTAGVPVMGHVGLTPQSVNVLGGYTVQGRGEAGERLIQDARDLEAAGAFAVVLEVVPAELAKRVTAELTIPTIGIGAGPDCDAQVLVWQDMAGLTPDPAPRFVKRYSNLRQVLSEAAQQFISDVSSRNYPGEDHAYS